MTMTRNIPGHWLVDATDATWLTDAAIEITGLAEGNHSLTFTVWLEVEAGATAVVQFKTGGLAETVGGTEAAAVTQAGPFSGFVSGVNVAGVDRSEGMILLHLSASTTDVDKPVELQDVEIEIG